MTNDLPPRNSLVLYKSYPAHVTAVGDKININLPDGKQLSVRPKDVTLLHPGPLASLSELAAPAGEVNTAWELLAGDTTTLPDLAELIYETFTPATAWAVWQLLEDGLLFYGEPDHITARPVADVEQLRADREAKAREQQQYAAFLQRMQAGQFAPEDERYLTDVELLAYGQQDKSRTLRDLNISQSRENAHALLLEIGYWGETVNPYPQRFNLPTTPPAIELPALPDEPRRDLTHLPAFAIDDEGSRDPDDAISLAGDRLWVHIADVAALAPPGSPADVEARARGASLYLPEGTVTMLPPAATPRLGLGLDDISPALSFGLELTPAGEVSLAEVTPSWVRVQRLSYDEADHQLGEAPLNQLHQLSQLFYARRQAQGAIELNLPEVKIRLIDGEIVIKPLPPRRSRDLVREAMLMTGEAVARYAQSHGIPLLFSTQATPSETGDDFPDTMAGHFARRRTLQRSQLSSVPAPHAGLGLELYAQTTSPLRRYADLVVHQQLRAHLLGQPLLDEAAVLERVGAAEAVSGSVRQAERLANKHWTLVYLQRRSDWRGEGVLVELMNRRGRVLIPALDLETQLHLREELPLDSRLPLRFSGVNLPELEAFFRLDR